MEQADKKPSEKIEGKREEKEAADWPKVLFYTYLQIFLILGLVLIVIEAKFLTTLYSIALAALAVLGTTAGSHRLWAHRSYTASTPLRIFLMLCQTLAGQGTIYDWVLLHRLHHKYHQTKNDPFNPSRGLLYAHMLSLMQKFGAKHDQLKTEIDMSDLKEDRVVMFQQKYYWVILPIIFLFSLNVPIEYWGESLTCTLCVTGWFRYALSLHLCWFIHSGIKIWGLEKGEKYPSDTNMIFFITTNHWISYHYLTPWDYQTGEYGSYGTDAISAFIRVCAALGHASDLRTLDKQGVQEALYLWVDTQKPVTDCLLEVEMRSRLPKDHFLQPAKYL